ncbi:MAG: protein-L-isoaspartate(D-aspartate) O-methyltransferase [Gemmatimonadota bacterium]|nr:MAG: protein-L-isoaspartate(D-aspartate) O-methyltransferase [Gemmatimonadota bacterium]
MTKRLVLILILASAVCSVSCNSEPSDRTDATPSNKEQTFDRARRQMVDQDLKSRDITDTTVLQVMGTVPRHKFVLERYLDQAYADHPLPIGEGQTISQPYIVALMTQWLMIGEGDTVLEVGTGSGYQAAVLAEIADRVYSVEIRETLAARADTLLHQLGYENIEVRASDGYYGWEEYAPFDGIIVTAAANHVPPPLIKQLKEGGRMVIPVGNPYSYQKLVLIEKKDGELFSRDITGVLFVPLVGEIEKEKKESQ